MFKFTNIFSLIYLILNNAKENVVRSNIILKFKLFVMKYFIKIVIIEWKEVPATLNFPGV